MNIPEVVNDYFILVHAGKLVLEDRGELYGLVTASPSAVGYRDVARFGFRMNEEGDIGLLLGKDVSKNVPSGLVYLTEIDPRHIDSLARDALQNVHHNSCYSVIGVNYQHHRLHEQIPNFEEIPLVPRRQAV